MKDLSALPPSPIGGHIHLENEMSTKVTIRTAALVRTLWNVVCYRLVCGCNLNLFYSSCSTCPPLENKTYIWRELLAREAVFSLRIADLNMNPISYLCFVFVVCPIWNKVRWSCCVYDRKRREWYFKRLVSSHIDFVQLKVRRYVGQFDMELIFPWLADTMLFMLTF